MLEKYAKILSVQRWCLITNLCCPLTQNRCVYRLENSMLIKCLLPSYKRDKHTRVCAAFSTQTQTRETVGYVTSRQAPPTVRQRRHQSKWARSGNVALICFRVNARFYTARSGMQQQCIFSCNTYLLNYWLFRMQFWAHRLIWLLCVGIYLKISSWNLSGNCNNVTRCVVISFYLLPVWDKIII